MNGTGTVVVAVVAFNGTIRIFGTAMAVVFPTGGAGMPVLAAFLDRRHRIMTMVLGLHHPGEYAEVEKQ